MPNEEIFHVCQDNAQRMTAEIAAHPEDILIYPTDNPGEGVPGHAWIVFAHPFEQVTNSYAPNYIALNVHTLNGTANSYYPEHQVSGKTINVKHEKLILTPDDHYDRVYFQLFKSALATIGEAEGKNSPLYQSLLNVESPTPYGYPEFTRTIWPAVREMVTEAPGLSYYKKKLNKNVYMDINQKLHG